MVQKIIIGFIVLALGLVTALFIPPFDHIRNYLLWGKHTLHDYQTHPSRTIPAASTSQPWQNAPNYNTKQIPDSLAKIIEAKDTHAFLVIQHGKLIYEHYFDGYDRNTLSGSFSVAKSILSMLIGIAIQEKRLNSVNQLVSDILPHFKTNGLAPIRLKDLLTMSSGTNYVESDLSAFGLPAQFYYADDMDYAINKLKAIEPAGRTWHYRSSDTQALGLVLEKVYGRSISALVSEKLLQPMGAEHESKWLLDGDKKHEKSFCCYNAVARDYARFGELILHNGNWKGKQLVSESYMKAALSPALYLKDPEEGNHPVDFYGFQFWLLTYKNYAISSMHGTFGQYVHVIPKKDMVIVRLGDSVFTKATIHHIQPENFTYIDAGLSLAD